MSSLFVPCAATILVACCCVPPGARAAEHLEPPPPEDWAAHVAEAADVSIEPAAEAPSPRVVLRLDAGGAAVARARMACAAEAGNRVRFAARVAARDIAPAEALPEGGNMHGVGVCVGIEQVNAAGLTIANAYSTAQPRFDEPLSVEAVVQPDTAELVLQCRAVRVGGTAVFDGMRVAVHEPAQPATAATVRIAANEEGGLVWEMGGSRQPLLAYHGNNLGPALPEVITEEFRLAYDAGIRLFTFNLSPPNALSVDGILHTIDHFMAPLPDARFIVRTWLHYPVAEEQRLMWDDGERSDLASPASPEWRRNAAFNIAELVRIITASPYGDRFAGVIPMYYQTGEWMVWSPERPAGFSEVAREQFQAWLEERYGSIATLNRAWGSDYGGFGAIDVPSRDERYTSDLGVFRDPARRRRAIAFTEWYNRLIPGSIATLAEAAASATPGGLFTGVFYGYTFESAWSPTWAQQTGHLGLRHLLRAPAVDVIGAPYSYSFANRYPGFPLDVHMPMDSMALHGKLAFLEEDTYTHLAEPPGEGVMAPGYHHRARNLDETRSVLRRNLGVALARGYVLYWQSLLSDGRFNDAAIWSMYADLLPVIERVETARAPYRPEVAVVIDETSYHLQRNTAHAVFGRWAYETRSSLTRTGTSIGFYLQSDLDRIPDSVRCLILLTPYRITPGQQDALRTRWMRDGRVVVFCYLPNVFTEDGIDPAGSAITGMNLALHDERIDPESQAEAGSIWGAFAGETLGDARNLNLVGFDPNARFDDVAPYMTVEDRDAEVLARYTDTGGVSCAMKRMDGWTSVFLGAHRLPAPMWHALFEAGDAHLYLEDISGDWDHPDVVEANEVFVMVQSGRDGRRTVHLPEAWPGVLRLDDGERLGSGTRIELDLEAGTPVYLGRE